METIEIIIGTYESDILGCRLVSRLDGSYSLENSFTENTQIGPLRCLYVSPNGILLFNNSDDSVRLYNLRKRNDLGQLFQHNGKVNSITFYKQSHMFTASDDGLICMWKTKNWEMVRALKGHKAHVMAVAVHPSGKLGLSIGSDRSLLTWDFVTGKMAFQRKIKEAAENILFTPCGSYYVLVFLKKIEICSLENTKIVQEITTTWRINAACFVQDNILAVGGDDRYILVVDVLTGKQLLKLDMTEPGKDAFSGRVRCLSAIVCNEDLLVIAATSSGNVKIFKVDLSKKVTEVVVFAETHFRVTCLTAYIMEDTKQLEDELPEVESKQIKMAESPKSHKKDLKRTKTRKAKAATEQPDGDVDEEVEFEDLNANTSRQAKKRKTQQSLEKPNKKRKLQATETQTTRIESSQKKMKKSSSRPKTQHLSAGKLKNLKKIKLPVK